MTQEHKPKHQAKHQEKDKPGWKKALWFVGLWLGGVLVLATIGFLIRLVLG